MSKVRGGLGRGLGALIPSTPPPPPPPPEVAVPAARDGGTPVAIETWDLAPVPGARFADIPVEGIVANPKQPRTVFDEEALDELKASIEEVGFLQPIVVREAGPERYELVMGERRWRAAQALGRETIPAIIRDTRDDAMLRDALLENIHRADLNPLEEAAAYQQLLDPLAGYSVPASAVWSTIFAALPVIVLFWCGALTADRLFTDLMRAYHDWKRVPRRR